MEETKETEGTVEGMNGEKICLYSDKFNFCDNPERTKKFLFLNIKDKHCVMKSHDSEASCEYYVKRKPM